MKAPTQPLPTIKSILDISPPIIHAQPISQIIKPGSTQTFTVSATGPGVLTYQWLKDQVPLVDRQDNRIAGAMNASLTIRDVQCGDAGSYSVVVANEMGQTTSDTAVFGVGLEMQRAVVWPQNCSDGYILETADVSTGPRTQVNVTPAVFAEKKLILLDTSELKKFYRLRKP